MILNPKASSVPFSPRHFIAKVIARATSLDELNSAFQSTLSRLTFYSAKAMVTTD